tara:strand:+ start:531 stop:2195 length:1665 start_codon:yes stop_codon:yes gene_type:complete
MPIAKVQLEDGRIARFEVPEGTTEAQVLQFAEENKSQLLQSSALGSKPQQQAPEAQEQELNLLQSAARFVEPALTVASSIVAEPLAGIAGIAQSINPLAESGAGAKAVEATRDALTFEPRTQQGQEGLQAVGETLAPIGEALSSAEEGLGDTVFNATGSPALAAAAKTAPTAILELIGLGTGRKIARATKSVTPSNRAVKSLLMESVPDADSLINISRGVYKELDNSGIRMKPQVYKGMVAKIEKAAKSQGLSKRTTKQAFGAIEDLKDVIGEAPTLSTIDDLRKVANGVAGNIDNTEKALGVRIVSEIDNFLDNISPKALQNVDGSPVNAGNVGQKYKAARNLWGRASKSKLVEEAIEVAKTRASGFENGIRIELGKLAKNRRTKKYFNKGEIDAIRSIEQGNASQNIAKFFGRFALNEGRANNILSSLGGIGAGSLAFGTAGAVGVPVVGQISRSIASKLTKGRAEFLSAVTKAGKDGEAITSAYISSVPRSARSTAELSNLLSDPTINLDSLITSANKNIREAAEIAAGRQVIGSAIGASVPVAIQQETQE